MPQADPISHPRTLAVHHERARRRGVQPVVYWVARAILEPAIRIWFRLGRTGREHVPKRGAVILAANHRSFLDPFVVACCVRRPVYFVAKRELFDNRLQGWLLNCLGAFPIRRGESDEQSTATALELLDRGEAVVIFPEGTRIRTGSLGRPRRGVGRLALTSGAPVVPVAVKGSERARRGWLIKPVKVKVRCGRPLTFPRAPEPSPPLAGAVAERIWPCVQLQWEWLGGLPPLRTAAVVGAGSMGTAAAALLARAGLEVQLACRTLTQAQRLHAERENTRYLPGVPLDPAIEVATVADVEFAAVDLVVLAVPCSRLPAVMAAAGAGIGERTGVLVLSKGLVPPLGTTPAAYVSERARARAVASLGGPAHARETLATGASVVLAAHDPHLARQLRDVLAGAGLCVETTDDLTGVELAACAKNAAALAAAAAGSAGPNMAGAAAGKVFSEVHRLASTREVRDETFTGLAGVGDLVGTALAGGSRNRRAGELVGSGLHAKEAAAMLDQTAEALATVPLLAQAMREDGVNAPVTTALAQVLEGSIPARSWLEAVRSPAARAA
jgi:glycerol-3-phosphate dehydrogenase (NAD(P)+)